MVQKWQGFRRAICPNNAGGKEPDSGGKKPSMVFMIDFHSYY
jgi:hypothetical protein